MPSTPRLRIVHFNYDDRFNPWYGGGTAVRAWELYRRLATRHEITVVCGAWPGARSEETLEGVRYLRAGAGLARNKVLSRLAYQTLGMRELWRIEKDLVVEDFNHFSPPLFSLLTWGPSLVQFHHGLGHEAFRIYGPLGVAPLAVEELFARLPSRIVCVTSGWARWLQRRNPRAVVDVIGNGASEEFFELERRDEGYMLFVARLDVHFKGIDVLLAALARARKSRPLRLLLAGPGDVEKILAMAAEAGVADGVEVLGRVSMERRLELFAGARLVVLPSRYEGQGIVCLEAAAAGKPLLGTRVMGIADTVIDGKTGVLVPSEDPDALAAAMLELDGDAERRRRLGDFAREWARQFTWERIAELWEALFLRIHAENSGAKS